MHSRSLFSKTLTSSVCLRAIARLTLIPHSLNLTADRTMSTERVFQLKLDPLTGNSEWVVIEENEDVPESSQEPLLATTSYLDMLNDSYRNKAYRLAIEKTVTKPFHVLDIGAGTGLLSMMAARAMASGDTTACSDTSGMVTACESYLPMVKLMRKVLHINGMGKNINVINKRSDELKVGVDVVSRADVLVSEILDSELLGEGLIPTLRHAHEMLLVENPLVVPYRATTYGVLVESEFLCKLHDLATFEAKASDNIHLVPTGLDTILCVKPQQHPMHCDAITKDTKLLSEPFKIFEFDLWKRPDSHGDIELQIEATDNGRVHAVVSWWVLQLDQEGTVFYSTAPRWISSPNHTSRGHWCDHWKQCVWFVPNEDMSVRKGEEVVLHAVHTETTVSYNLKSQLSKTEVKQHDLTVDGLKLMLPPERIAIYGNNEWRSSILQALRTALQQKARPFCIVADDSVFLTIGIAHLFQGAHVLSLFPGLKDKAAGYLKAVADANCFSMDCVKVNQKKRSCLTMDVTLQKKVDLLIGEPYYYGNDGMLPWQNLRFWKERTMLDPLLKQDALIMPCKGILKACAMSLPDLWNSRRSLSKIEGFDHAVVNTILGACGDLPAPKIGPCLPFFIWQCGKIKELSEVFTVMEFDFSKPISPCHGKSPVHFLLSRVLISLSHTCWNWQSGYILGVHLILTRTMVEFTEPGMCHGFALWIDWVMDPKNTIVISTGPDKKFWKQGVKLLATPVEVGLPGSRTATGKPCSAEVETSFDPVSGELNIKHTFA